MDAPVPTLEARLAVIDEVLRDPPQIHPNAPSGVWSTRRDCYALMAGKLEAGARTLETGAGVSTILFAAWGCKHLCIVPTPAEEDGIRSYCANSGIDTSSVEFDLAPSQLALPRLAASGTAEFDLFLIDGCHGFPLPIIDWFYGGGMLRQGGVVVFDDLQIPQVSHFLEWYLNRDQRWTQLQWTDKWAAYRRESAGPLGELHGRQTFLDDLKPRPSQPSLQSALGLLRRHLRRQMP